MNRADGYRIYRQLGGKWSLVADVAASKTSYADKTVASNTRYIYTVRAYKKAGNVKYLGVLKKSSAVTTPKKTVSSSNSKFTSAQKEVRKKSSMLWKQADRFMEIRDMMISQKPTPTARQSMRSRSVQVSGMRQRHSDF